MKFKTYPNPYLATDSANTLRPTDIGLHHNGWTVTGEIHEDWYEWVNYFEASHPKYGQVKGDFENSTLQATSEKALREFCKHFKPESWDYQDI